MSPSHTFSQILTMAPAEPSLSEDVIGKLELAWGELPAQEIGARSIPDLVMELLLILPKPWYDNARRVAVANDVHKVLKAFGLLSAASQQASKVALGKPHGGTDSEKVFEVIGRSSGRSNAQDSPGLTDRQLLEAAATATCDHDGMGTKVRGGLYRTIKVRGMNASIKGTIVLESGVIDGMSASGEIFAPPGVSITVRGMNATVKVTNLSWSKLADRARRAGLID